MSALRCLIEPWNSLMINRAQSVLTDHEDVPCVPGFDKYEDTIQSASTMFSYDVSIGDPDFCIILCNCVNKAAPLTDGTQTAITHDVTDNRVFSISLIR